MSPNYKRYDSFGIPLPYETDWDPNYNSKDVHSDLLLYTHRIEIDFHRSGAILDDVQIEMVSLLFITSGCKVHTSIHSFPLERTKTG